jgi:spectinomycin phosphotransferase
MFGPPDDVTDIDVLDAVRRHWLPGATSTTHLAVGFGAHHWAIADTGGRRLFTTLDGSASRHSAESLEATYAAAAALAGAGVPGVWPPLPSRSGPFTVPLGRGRLSATRWLDGRHPSEAESRAVAPLLEVLHRTPPPPGVLEWAAVVDTHLPARLRARAAVPWTAGPFGEQARAALISRLDVIEGWTRRYAEFVRYAEKRRSTWVLTHGEPGPHNQLVTADGLWLVDWESLMVAPRERDLSGLSWTADLDPPDELMLELFRLDWRLSEIEVYARQLSGPHTDSVDDRTALGGFLDELG